MVLNHGASALSGGLKPPSRVINEAAETLKETLEML